MTNLAVSEIATTAAVASILTLHSKNDVAIHPVSILGFHEQSCSRFVNSATIFYFHFFLRRLNFRGVNGCKW